MTFINLFKFHIASKANAILLLLARRIKQTVNPPTPPSSRHPLQVPVHLRPLASKDLNVSSTLVQRCFTPAVSSTCYCGATGHTIRWGFGGQGSRYRKPVTQSRRMSNTCHSKSGPLVDLNSEHTTKLSSGYPTLVRIALDVLPCRASSVPCERLFSASKRTAVDRRASLGAEELQVMKFAWRHEENSSFTGINSLEGETSLRSLDDLGDLDISFETAPSDDGKIRVRIHPLRPRPSPLSVDSGSANGMYSSLETMGFLPY